MDCRPGRRGRLAPGGSGAGFDVDSAAGEEERMTPPAFYINDHFGCIGHFWWVNTIQQPSQAWNPMLFPIWGAARWFRG